MAKTNPTHQQNAPKGNGGQADDKAQASDPTKPPKKKRSGDRKKVELVWHPDLKVDPATGEPTAKLTAIPADYKTNVHKQLNAKHFESVEVFYELMAQRYDDKAKRFREMAVQAKSFGGISDKAGAKKLSGLVKRLDDLKAEMAGKGIDVEAMLKLLAEQRAAAAAKAAAPEGETKPAETTTAA